MRLETTGQDCVIPPPSLELRLRGDQFSRGFPPLFLSTADIINTCCFSLQTSDSSNFMSLLSGRKMTFFSNSVFYEVMNTSINPLCSYMDNFFVFLDDLKDSEEIFLF